MTHGNPHEEAEHASHHAQDPFDKRVAMSMVVIAAVLAMVKVLGHRTHNETLAYQIKSGGAQSQSGVYHTQESDQWNFFQSKKMREVLARQEGKLLQQQTILAKEAASPTPLPDKGKRFEELVKELKDEKVDDPDKEAQRILDGAEKRYHVFLAKRFPPDAADRIIDTEITAERYRTEGKAIAAKANAKKKEAEKYAEKSEQYLEKSHHKHKQADYFDLGELGVELALVLSSVAILTKRSNYWYAGLVLGVLGVCVVLVGLLV